MNDLEMTDKDTISLYQWMKQEFPNLKIKFKDDFWIYRFLSKFIRGEVLYRMTTTLFNVILMSSREKCRKGQRWYFDILAHEFVHLFQFRNPVKLVFTYLAPQIWILIPVAAILCVTWWHGYVHSSQVILTIYLPVMMLFPWPSPWRLKAEMEAYTMSLAVRVWRGKQLTPKHISDKVELMTSIRYWKMGWNKEKTIDKFMNYINLLQDKPDRLREISPAFEIVRKVLQK